MIDLRSDTVTLPTPEMYDAIAKAPLGDDTYDRDPTVRELEEICADIVGHESGLFCVTGTQANLLALLTHCRRGDEFIAGETYHIFRHEGGGGASLAGVSAQSVPVEEDGSISLSRVEAAIKPDDIHYARTSLLCFENTVSGKAMNTRYCLAAAAFARHHRVRSHLDGARLMNAAISLHAAPRDLAAPFDSVTLCLSKGLCAPAGTVLCGSADFIERARRWRKTLGGSLRQAGVLAACGIVALKSNVERLAIDHHHAGMLASGLKEISEVLVDSGSAHTNMVLVTVNAKHHAAITDFVRSEGVLVTGPTPKFRLVTHAGISPDGIRVAIESFKKYFHVSSRLERPPSRE